MTITLKRIYKAKAYTIGRLYVDQIYLCDTIEDCDRGLKQKWTLEQIKAAKVYGETAIPSGTYEVVLTASPKFRNRVWAKKYGGVVPQVADVKGFSGVRIHPANRATELLGCIAPGKNTIKGAVTQSQATFYKLMDNHILPAAKRGERVYLTIQ